MIEVCIKKKEIYKLHLFVPTEWQQFVMVVRVARWTVPFIN